MQHAGGVLLARARPSETLIQSTRSAAPKKEETGIEPIQCGAGEYLQPKTDKVQFVGLFQTLPYEWDCPINSNLSICVKETQERNGLSWVIFI